MNDYSSSWPMSVCLCKLFFLVKPIQRMSLENWSFRKFIAQSKMPGWVAGWFSWKITTWTLPDYWFREWMCGWIRHVDRMKHPEHREWRQLWMAYWIFQFWMAGGVRVTMAKMVGRLVMTLNIRTLINRTRSIQGIFMRLWKMKLFLCIINPGQQIIYQMNGLHA